MRGCALLTVDNINSSPMACNKQREQIRIVYEAINYSPPRTTSGQGGAPFQKYAGTCK